MKIEFKETLQNNISNNKADDIYNECINLGATGGKLLEQVVVVLFL